MANYERIRKLRDALSSGLYEKEEAVRLGLLTAIAGESIFFLGSPGCAKSMVARRIVQAFKSDGDGAMKYFETLLNQYTTPDEVFGNVSLKALNGELPDENGVMREEYRRLTENMLPEADIAFVDEIWKAGPAILNTLLTIVNERKFHNGGKVMDVPLKALFAASNELPAQDCGLDARYDRLVLRLPVGFIRNENRFYEMIEDSAPESGPTDEIRKLQISDAELREWKGRISAVALSGRTKAVITAVRRELALRNGQMSDEDRAAGEAFEVGDRRWKKIARLLKTSAFLNDRTETDLTDCRLIAYCIWSTEKQQKASGEIVDQCIRQNGLAGASSAGELKGEVERFRTLVDENWFEKAPDPPSAPAGTKRAPSGTKSANLLECEDLAGNLRYVEDDLGHRGTGYVRSDRIPNSVKVYDENRRKICERMYERAGNVIVSYRTSEPEFLVRPHTGPQEIVSFDGRDWYACCDRGNNRRFVSVKKNPDGKWHDVVVGPGDPRPTVAWPRTGGASFDTANSGDRLVQFLYVQRRFAGSVSGPAPEGAGRDALRRKSLPKVAEEALRDHFDREYYAPLRDRIRAKIASTKKALEEERKNDRTNLFTGLKGVGGASEAVAREVDELENVGLELEKQRHRYAPSES